MAEDTEAPASSGGASGESATAAGQQPTFTIYTQYIKDFSFENPNAPRIFLEMKEAPEVSVDLDVSARQLQSNTYEVTLSADVKATSQDRSAFMIELKYAGLVGLDESISANQREQLLLIEAPRFLFPFARAIVSAATRDGGFPPLLISPVDFVKLYRERKAAAQSGQDAQESGGSADATAAQASDTGQGG